MHLPSLKELIAGILILLGVAISVSGALFPMYHRDRDYDMEMATQVAVLSFIGYMLFFLGFLLITQNE